MANEGFEMSGVSKTFCILPFIHLSTRTNGAMQLCCHANSSSGPDYRQPGLNRKENGEFVYVDKDKPSEYWNTTYMKQVRKKLINGQVPKECRVCYKEEATGYRSKRLWENAEWSEKIDFDSIISQVKEDGEAPFDIHYADMKLGNKCDLACLMCNPADSSLWIPDYNKLMQSDISEESKSNLEWRKGQGKLNWYKLDSVFWEDIKNNLSTMTNFYIIGGEPTINKEFESFLQMCVDSGYAKNMNIRFNTNGHTTTDALNSLYKGFKSVLVHLSLDGINEHHDLIRFPSKWNEAVKKLDYWDNTPDNMTVTIDCTASILNILHIPDLVKWKLEQNFKKINVFPRNQGLLGIHLVHSPDILNLTVLPKHLKEKVRQVYKDFRKTSKVLQDFQKFDALIQFMDSKDNSHKWPRTLEYLDNMDKIRNTNWRSVLTDYDN